DEGGPIVHCPRDGLDGHRDLVRALDHHQLHPTSPLCEPLVGKRGKVERRNHDLGTAPVVQRLRHCRQRHRNAGRERDLLGARGRGRQYTRGRAGWARRATTFPPMRASAGWPALTMRLVLRALVNPRLALDLVRLTWSFRTRDWYRRPPFLPLPPRDYVRWRMFTAYGDEDAVPPLEDVVRFARWRRETMHV